MLPMSGRCAIPQPNRPGGVERLAGLRSGSQIRPPEPSSSHSPSVSPWRLVSGWPCRWPLLGFGRMNLEVTRADIEAAASRISAHIRVTPVVGLGDVFEKGWRLSLKLDHLQPTGSFKARGAFSVLTARTPTTGVAAASGGNFGIAIAYACSKLGISGNHLRAGEPHRLRRSIGSGNRVPTSM